MERCWKNLWKTAVGDAVLVAALSHPHQRWELLVIILMGFWGDCAENLIPNPKSLIPCGSVERWTGVVHESHLIPWAWVFFPRSLEIFFFLFFFPPPSSLSFLLIRLCWGAVSIQKAPRWVFPSAAAFRGWEKDRERKKYNFFFLNNFFINLFKKKTPCPLPPPRPPPLFFSPRSPIKRFEFPR